MRAALRERHDADVPCGDCCACCTTAHFVHIGPGELDTLAHVPPALLFAAPGHPAGTVLMGYDERGRCPLLRDCLCSIYEHRPLTCRMYDCRVFAAAGIDADRDEITRRAHRWSFGYPSPRDRVEHDAVRAAARFVADRGGSLPAGDVPRDPPRLAVLALSASDAFLPASTGAPYVDPAASEPSDEELARQVLAAARRLMLPSSLPDTC